MRFELFVISVLLALLFLIGGIAIIEESYNAYDITPTDSMIKNVTLYKADLKNKSTTLKDSLSSNPISTDTAENSLFAGGFISITQIWGYTKIVGNLLSSVATSLGIPGYVVDIFMIIIMISLIFSIIYMIFRFMPR